MTIRDILILTQYFPPESGAPSVRLMAMAQELQKLGFRVRVVTGMPNYPLGVIYPKSQRPSHHARRNQRHTRASRVAVSGVRQRSGPAAVELSVFYFHRSDCGGHGASARSRVCGGSAGYAGDSCVAAEGRSQSPVRVQHTRSSGRACGRRRLDNAAVAHSRRCSDGVETDARCRVRHDGDVMPSSSTFTASMVCPSGG